MKKVAIIYRYVPHYRKEFYNGLRQKLLKNGVELILIYGQANHHEELKHDAIDLEWGTKVPSVIWSIGKFDIYWQPVLKHLKNADLVIVEQASKLLVNYVLLIQNILHIRRLAFWGHGKNLQSSSSNPFGEWIKRRVSTHVHWWFAYNEMSYEIVKDMGFPESRITNVQNSIDTRPLIQAYEKITPGDIDRFRQESGIHGSNAALYVGGMYPEKRLPFLLNAIQLIRQEIPDFEMIFIGGGVNAYLVQQAADNHSWIHYLGAKFSGEIVPFFLISKLLLMPGLVGLVILDAFALGTPLITTTSPDHGPEISYLKNNINGMIIRNDVDPLPYASAIIDLFRDQEKIDLLIEGCRAASKYYTVEAMIDNFAEGIMKAINS